MEEKILIRHAAISDIPLVVDLWQEHQEYHAALEPWFERSENPNPGFQQYLEEHLDDLGLFVAEVDKSLVGFILGEIASRPPCFAERKYGMIDDLAVTAAWRGKGIGKKLLTAMSAWFKENDIHRIETRLLLANPLAGRFWQAAGFTAYMNNVYREV